MPRTRPPYPPEFRREAIKLVRISSKSQHQIAEDLGISDVTLRNSVDQGSPPALHVGRRVLVRRSVFDRFSAKLHGWLGTRAWAGHPEHLG